MIHEKRIGEYCTFLKQYVPVRYYYPPNGDPTKNCENSTICGNSECILSAEFKGDKHKGKNFLGQPGKEVW